MVASAVPGRNDPIVLSAPSAQALGCTLMEDRRRRLVAFAALGVALGLLVAVQSVYFQRGFVPGDAFNYLGAGERLNSGHDLCRLQPGDRIGDAGGEYWLVPS